MSRIDELIQKLCPNGVSFSLLKDCCNVLDNLRKPVTSSSRIAGDYPYYGANGIQDYVSDYIFDGKFILVGEDGSVITKNGNPVVTWAEGKIWVNNHAHIISEKDGIRLRFLFHYLQTIGITNLVHGNIPKLTGGDFKSFKIPVPPLQIQDEIVKVLDAFVDDIGILNQELNIRKKQYEYYRNQLLLLNNSEWFTIEDLLETKGGYTPSKSNPAFWENGDIPWFRMEDIRQNGRILTDAIQHVTKLSVKKAGLFQAGSIIMATTATIGEHAIVLNDFLCNQQMTVLTIKEKYKGKLLPKFVYYYCYIIDSKCSSVANYSGGIPIVDQSQFRKLAFPLPSLEEQKCIIDTLDQFEVLLFDKTSGLPAEINARQKQYEYYRDLLLNFKEEKK